MTAAAKISECLVRAAAPGDMAAVTAIYTHFVETSTATFDLVAPGEATMLRYHLLHVAPLIMALPLFVGDLGAPGGGSELRF